MDAGRGEKYSREKISIVFISVILHACFVFFLVHVSNVRSGVLRSLFFLGRVAVSSQQTCNR